MRDLFAVGPAFRENTDENLTRRMQSSRARPPSNLSLSLSRRVARPARSYRCDHAGNGLKGATNAPRRLLTNLPCDLKEGRKYGEARAWLPACFTRGGTVNGIRLTGNRGSHLRVHDLSSRARRPAYNYTLNLDLLYGVMSTVGGGTDRLHGNARGLCPRQPERVSRGDLLKVSGYE